MTKPLEQMTVDELLGSIDEFFAIRKLVPTVHGQMMGQETYRILASGERISLLIEAVNELARRNKLLVELVISIQDAYSSDLSPEMCSEIVNVLKQSEGEP